MTEYTHVIGYRYDIEKFDTEYSLSSEETELRSRRNPYPGRWDLEVQYKDTQGDWQHLSSCRSDSLLSTVQAYGYYLTKEKAMEAALSLLRNKQSCCTNKVARLTQKIASIQKLLDAPLA